MLKVRMVEFIFVTNNGYLILCAFHLRKLFYKTKTVRRTTLAAPDIVDNDSRSPVTLTLIFQTYAMKIKFSKESGYQTIISSDC